MPDAASSGGEDRAGDAPAPEVLQAQDDNTQAAAEGNDVGGAPSGSPGGDGGGAKPATPPKKRRLTFRPSHKATFVGLAVVVGILAVNAVVFMFVLRGNDAAQQPDRQEVTISTEELDKLGVNRSAPGTLGAELIVGPDARFNGKVSVANNVDIAGQLTLNSKFSASGARLTELQAGKTSLEELNVNGKSTLSDLSVRKGLSVAGITQLQGAVTVSNNLNVIGNLSVGGSLFASTFQISNLIFGGHVQSRGVVPSVSAGSKVGSNGTVSISGNDAAGTVAVNAGTGAGNGVLATVTFRSAYTATPHVLLSPVGNAADGIYVNRSSTGFSIVARDAIPSGGYAFDYFVVQ